MKRFFFILLLFPYLLNAQINESDSLNFKANLQLTGFLQTGNVETLIFRAKSDVSLKLWKNTIFKTQNSYIYQEFGKEKADEDILSLNFLYFNPERKIYPFVLGFFSTNFRREINSRYLVGGGLTYNILNKNKNWLKASLSLEYENTDFKNTNFNISSYNGMNEINTFRSTIWVNGKYFLCKDKLILTHENFFQPSLEKGDNYRWQADIGIELPLWKYLNFKVNYLRTFESLVVTNQKREDSFLTLGFTLKNY